MGDRYLFAQADVARALRGWQDYHMDDRGWSDIAYQVAVDMAGRAWNLRGLTFKSAANGDQTVNHQYGAILLVIGSGQTPTGAMINTTRNVVADFRRWYPKATAIKPHSAVRPSGTDCPGDVVRKLIAARTFEPITVTAPKEYDMASFTEDQIRAMVQAELEEYNRRFWVDPTGTGTAIRHELDEIRDAVTKIAETAQ
jgi:hypothetical protein